MRNFLAQYYPGKGAAAAEASLLVFDTYLSIGWRNEDGQSYTARWMLKEISAKYEPAAGATIIRHLTTGEEVQVSGKDAASYISELMEESARPWFKSRKAREQKRVLLFFTILVAILIAVYLFLVPWMAERAAAKLPTATEREIGDALYSAMQAGMQEDTAASRKLNQFFAAMHVPTDYSIRIAVIQDPTVNAFALPGGQIVVYTGLLNQLSSYPELAALLSHEFIHVNNRHATKSIFRKMGSKIFISLLFGRMGSIAGIVANHADDLKSLTYSRSLETESDTAGLRLLQERKIDPGGFIRLFRRLQASAPVSGTPEMLSSHPDTEKRIELIKELSKTAEIMQDEDLKAIFNSLKP